MIAETLRSAMLGFLVCAAASCLFSAVLYFGAGYQAEKYVTDLVKTFHDTETEARAFLIEDGRWVATGSIRSLLTLFAIYWSVAGILSKKLILRLWSANLLLLLGSMGIVIRTLNRYFYWAETYCDQLPYPHQGFQILKIYECPSSQMFFSFFGFISIMLFLISLIVRVVISRIEAKTVA